MVIGGMEAQAEPTVSDSRIYANSALEKALWRVVTGDWGWGECEGRSARPAKIRIRIKIGREV
jgi:hypothetical protein